MIITTLQWLAEVGGRSKSKAVYLLSNGVHSLLSSPNVSVGNDRLTNLLIRGFV